MEEFGLGSSEKKFWNIVLDGFADTPRGSDEGWKLNVYMGQAGNVSE